MAGAVVGLDGGLAAGRAEALARMDSADLDALPVVHPDRPAYPDGVVTRAGASG